MRRREMAQRVQFSVQTGNGTRSAIWTTPGRAVAARGAHNPEVGGSNPPPATNASTSSVFQLPHSLATI